MTPVWESVRQEAGAMKINPNWKILEILLIFELLVLSEALHAGVRCTFGCILSIRRELLWQAHDAYARACLALGGLPRVAIWYTLRNPSITWMKVA